MYAPLTAAAELRPLESWQAEEFLANLDRCRDHIKPWVGASFVATDLAGARDVLERYADRRRRDDGGIWGIWQEGRLVGGVMFVSFDVGQGVCEAGCWLEPGAEGQGLVTRAAERILDWAIRERGIQRVEWHTKAGNVRSVAVAKRLGMSRDAVLRSVGPDGHGGRTDGEIWSVLAPEWRARSIAADDDRAQIDRLVASFFALFTNADGAVPDVGSIHRLFASGGVIVQGGPQQQICDLETFAAPWQKLLTSGELTGFSEEETWEQTAIFGDVAQRLSRYRRRGVLRGEPFTGAGTKSIQFLRTPDGWRMTSVGGDDDRPVG
ncbi:GNAT family N-acetyltransferase [Micromonospora endolithica]|uniref:GNAT family N-acetyltransferase n=1 Tax=Micromonospora endolithica TaxID=230091 RepID=A0A3A9ZIH2_9ACTN|nr:GNAT family N-acetyltransferase [Micromonospora endolithica]TWJ21292.1 RimJ/RimL family protein N-acetyltransferase [Micromonospora endolithica]